MPRIRLPLPLDDLRVNKVKGKMWQVVERAKATYDLMAMPWINRQRTAWATTPAYPVHLTVTLYLGRTEKGRLQSCDASDAGTWLKRPIDLLVKEGAFTDDGPKYINPFLVRIDWDVNDPRIELEW